MSAKPDMSPASDRAASAHPLRAISFGNPAVTIERRDDGTIYLRPKAKLRIRAFLDRKTAKVKPA